MKGVECQKCFINIDINPGTFFLIYGDTPICLPVFRTKAEAKIFISKDKELNERKKELKIVKLTLPL